MSRRNEPGMALLRAFQHEQELSRNRNGLVDLNVLWAACGNHHKSNPRAYVEKENRLYDAEIEITSGPNGECFVCREDALRYAMDVNVPFAKILTKGLSEALSSHPGRSMLQCPDNPFMSLATTVAVMGERRVSAEEAKRTIIQDAISETNHLHEHVQARAVGAVEKALNLSAVNWGPDSPNSIEF